MARNAIDITEAQGPAETPSFDASGSIIIEDAALLFGGTFQRAGPDLVIRKDGSETVRIEDYFSSATPSNLTAANGAVLRGDLVEILAGPLAPGQYAQVGVAPGANPIGQVEKLEGGATVQRTDGTVETLQIGMKIFEKDLLQTEDGATLSVTFVDGTIFTLASASRMVIDELIYDPNANDNSGGFSLIQGGFVFIAGQVAKTGGMDVSTPSSTMGIRGTTVVVETANRDGIEVTEVTLVPDPDGDIGRIIWRDNADQVIADIRETDVKWTYTTGDGVAREVQRNGLDQIEDSVLVAEAFAAFFAATQRVDAGDTFVTLSDPTPALQNGVEGTDDGLNLEIDTIDEPDAIDPGGFETVPDTGTDTSQPFDDGNLIQSLPESLQTVSVQGPEDSPFAIAGSLNLTGFDGLIQSISVASAPENGEATVNPDGTFTFVPEANFNGADFFTFVVVNEEGDQTEGTVEINVLPVNDAPTASDLANFVAEDGVLSGPIAVTDIDGDDLVFSVASAPASGTLVVVQNGTYAYAPDPDFFGTDNFAIRATDPFGESAVSTITVLVSAEADAPSIVLDPEQSASEINEDSEDLSVGGLLSARDGDPGDALTWSGGATGALGAFTIEPDGNWTYTLDPALSNALQQDQIVTEAFVATVTDLGGLTDTVTVEVAVIGSNDGPILKSLASDAQGNVTEGDEVVLVSGQLVATDPDANESVVWTGVSSAAFGAFTLSAQGGWTYTLDNSLADVLAQGETATETFAATATETNGRTLTQIIEVTITGTNDLPIVSSNTFFQTIEGNEVAGVLTASDLDGAIGTLTFDLEGSQPENGTVTLNPDGSFQYTPDAGFVGVDGFEYSVTDGVGGQVTARARVSVQSDPADTLNQSVQLGINAQATADTAAGAVEIAVEPVAAPALNVAIALDRSGSIGAATWPNMVDAVRVALEALRAQFAPTATTVDVQLITFASDVRTSEVFDLQDPALMTAVDDLVPQYRGGATRWDLAFQEAGDFFFNEPAVEPNFLLFVTDGQPTSSAWETTFAELVDDTDAFDVTVNAFGFGRVYEEGSLDGIDPSAVLLSDPSQLSDAFTTIALFNPDLISLEVVLETEDTGPIVLADIDVIDGVAPGLIVEGTDFEFPLAGIEGIADLLGETNQVGITASFDINGDTSAAEFQLFSSDVIGKAQEAQVLTGQDRPDLLFGSDSGDDIQGGGGNDVVLAYGGDDTIDAGIGADTVLAGAGNDLIVVSDLPELGDIIDGGADRDTLRLEAVGEINSMIASLDLAGIEVVDIQNEQVDNLQLDFQTIAELSDTSDTDLETLLDAALPNAHTILGDANDTLVLDGEGIYQVAQTDLINDADSGAIEIWSFSDGGGNVLATLGVNSDVDVSTTNVVA